MRKKIVAGNWKMNKTFAEGVELAREVNDYVRYKEGGEGVLVVLGTPFIHLAKVAHTSRNLPSWLPHKTAQQKKPEPTRVKFQLT
jgi:triosephosphate isomerase